MIRDPVIRVIWVIRVLLLRESTNGPHDPNRGEERRGRRRMSGQGTSARCSVGDLGKAHIYVGPRALPTAQSRP